LLQAEHLEEQVTVVAVAAQADYVQAQLQFLQHQIQ
jgi:hypothetical protein